MSNYLVEIKKLFNVIDAQEIEQIQSIWSDYGKIVRVELASQQPQTIIAKHIIFPHQNNHPRGWNTNNSHQRKVKSYQVEINWYKNWSEQCDDSCKVPKCYGVKSVGEEQLICLEDLDALGYSIRKSHLTIAEVKLCLKWLASFHAKFMGQHPKGLWQVGTYWHLATRFDELNAMNDGDLKQSASKIDRLLNNCKYQTIVHGDAKVANFCFNDKENKVAAVDFQYIGGGCGIKDVVYLLGSCLTELECETHEKELLSFYFDQLKITLNNSSINLNFSDLETEWRGLYTIAWTDFTRFLMGWMPTHQKVNGYSKKLMLAALSQIPPL